MAKHKIVHSNKSRWNLYVVAGVIMAAGIAASLIMAGLFTLDDAKDWAALVVALVVGIVGLGQSILSAVNTDKVDTPPVIEPQGPLGQARGKRGIYDD